MESVVNWENLPLEGQFTINHRSKPLYTVSVSRAGIVYYATPSLSRHGTSNESGTVALRESFSGEEISFDDAVGCSCMKGKKTTDTAAYLVVYAYPRKKKFTNKSCRRRETLTIKFDHFSTFDENQEQAQKWNVMLTSLISRVETNLPTSMPCTIPSLRKMLVLVNPFSGPGKALHIFQQQVIPIFAEAGLLYHLVITEYAGHARDIVKQINLEEWFGIIIVSGDGLIYEVVNGLMERPDWEKAIKKPLGTIPGGSGNALACAVCHDAGEPYLEKHILHSTFIIAKNDVVPMDLVAVDTCTGKRLYSFLSFGWGMMADVDIESEKYRNIGNARFAVMAMMKIASMKRYHGRLSFLPVDNYIPLGDTSSPKYTRDTEDKEIKDDNFAADPNLVAEGGDSDGRNCHATAEVNGALGDNSRIPTPLLVPLTEPVPSNWVTVEDVFILVGAVYQSHLAKDNLMVPNATLNDGIIHLVLVKATISRMRLAQVFSKLETGSQPDDPSTEIVKVRAFRLEPLTPKGLMTLDGELIDYGPIQAQVLPSMARIMSKQRSGTSC